MEGYLLRLVMAGIVGFIVGIISTREDNTSSVQVFVIICMSAALITITSIGVFRVLYLQSPGDPSRIPAQLISALGFIGTGMMWLTHEKGVLGINSAASLWITAIMGMLIGAGLHHISVLGMFFFALIYWLSNFIRS